MFIKHNNSFKKKLLGISGSILLFLSGEILIDEFEPWHLGWVTEQTALQFAYGALALGILCFFGAIFELKK